MAPGYDTLWWVSQKRLKGARFASSSRHFFIPTSRLPKTKTSFWATRTHQRIRCLKKPECHFLNRRLKRQARNISWLLAWNLFQKPTGSRVQDRLQAEQITRLTNTRTFPHHLCLKPCHQHTAPQQGQESGFFQFAYLPFWMSSSKVGLYFCFRLTYSGNLCWACKSCKSQLILSLKKREL